MSVDAHPDKLLRYLLQQSGGERNSSLKNLSREKLVEALNVSLQKLDQNQAVKEHGTSRNEPAQAAVLDPQSLSIKTEEPIMYEAEENRGQKRKRKTETLPTLNTNANKRYRTRSKTTAAVIESDFKSLPEKKPYQPTIKKEADKDVLNDDMNEQPSDEDTTEAVSHEAQETWKDVSTFVASLSFKELQVMMSIPEHNGTVYLRNTNTLQRRFQRRLSGGLKQTLPLGGLFKFSQHITEDADFASKYLDKPLCISSLIAGCDAPAESLRPDKDPISRVKDAFKQRKSAFTLLRTRRSQCCVWCGNRRRRALVLIGGVGDIGCVKMLERKKCRSRALKKSERSGYVKSASEASQRRFGHEMMGGNEWFEGYEIKVDLALDSLFD